MTRPTVPVLALVLAAALLVGPATVATGAPSSSPRVAPAGVAAPADPPRFRDGRGIRVLRAVRVGGREWRLRLRTTALERPVRVRLLLPRGYARSQQRYPVLHLHHGTSGGAGDWIEAGRADRLTARLPLVVVMPDAGHDGNGGSWFTDWVDQRTPLGRARWETFHVRQLVPWVDDNLRTVRARHARAVAGLSQGGFGAMSYAARHPDRFVSVASFSGAPDIAWHPLARSVGPVVVGAILSGLNGVQPFAAFGDPVLDAVVWQGHNPANLVRNLAHTDVRLWTADGTPGELDEGPPDPASSTIEAFTHLSTRFFAQAADRAGVRYHLRDYGKGTHSYAYWSRDLAEYLGPLMRVLGERRAAPRAVRHRAVERTWAQWGWRVENRRTARHAWSALRDAGPAGFTFVGGRAVVRTPAVHRPGRSYRVAYRGGTGPQRVRADRDGRIRLLVRPTRTGEALRVRFMP